MSKPIVHIEFTNTKTNETNTLLEGEKKDNVTIEETRKSVKEAQECVNKNLTEMMKADKKK